MKQLIGNESTPVLWFNIVFNILCSFLQAMQNALISSIVQVTNLPRRRIVKWFEDRRAEEGVPKRRAPYQRSDPETVFSS